MLTLGMLTLGMLAAGVLAAGVLSAGVLGIGVGPLAALAARPEKGKATDRCHDYQNLHCLFHVH
jgi:hypothetical protein